MTPIIKNRMAMAKFKKVEATLFLKKKNKPLKTFIFYVPKDTDKNSPLFIIKGKMLISKFLAPLSEEEIKEIDNFLDKDNLFLLSDKTKNKLLELFDEKFRLLILL